MASLLIATTNTNKLREIRSIVSGSFELFTLWYYPDYEQPEETGQTCEENAVLKATHAAEHLGVWALADDSGLFVPSLGGRPGVHSARYAGEDASYKENRKKLLEEMKAFDDLQRHCRFEAWMALADPAGSLVKVVQGVCEGEILYEERGGSGFGYDSIFRKHGYSKSFGELSEDVKNRISHRTIALEKILPSIEAIH